MGVRSLPQAGTCLEKGPPWEQGVCPASAGVPRPHPRKATRHEIIAFNLFNLCPLCGDAEAQDGQW